MFLKKLPVKNSLWKRNLFIQPHMFLQIRKRFKRKILHFFDEEASFKTSYGVTYSSTSERASENSRRNISLDERTGDSAWLKNIEVNPSNRNSKCDDSEESNSPLKKIKNFVNYYYCKYFK